MCFEKPNLRDDGNDSSSSSSARLPGQQVVIVAHLLERGGRAAQDIHLRFNNSRTRAAMFSGALQSELLSILFSCGSKPLAIWDCKAKNGHIKRITDGDIGNSLVLELTGTNVATTYITTPVDPQASLGIKLPFLCLIMKNLKKYFSFEITFLDDKNMRRRLRASNYQSAARVRPFSCNMPLPLNNGWNQVQFNLADFARRAYGSTYVECVRVQVHANCRIRRIYFSDHLFSESELPSSYRLLHTDDAELAKQRRQQHEQMVLQQRQQALLP